jgi:hypothetical protein
MVQSCRDQNRTRNFVVPNQLQEISSPESVISTGKDNTRRIQSRFVY